MEDLAIVDVVYGDSILHVRGTDAEVVLGVESGDEMLSVHLDAKRALHLIARLQTLVGAMAAAGRASKPSCSLCIKAATGAITDGVSLAYTCPDHQSRIFSTQNPQEAVYVGLTHD